MVDSRDRDTAGLPLDPLDPLMDGPAPALRPTFEAIFAGFARHIARRSTCVRRQVGCVITSADYRYVYGLGYNGGAAGEHDACTGLSGRCGCLHAEDNATINCVAPRETRKVVFVTTWPCVDCAARLINLGGVTKVYYLEPYRCGKGLARLAEAGIHVERIEG